MISGACVLFEAHLILRQLCLYSNKVDCIPTKVGNFVQQFLCHVSSKVIKLVIHLLQYLSCPSCTTQFHYVVYIHGIHILAGFLNSSFLLGCTSSFSLSLSAKASSMSALTLYVLAGAFKC